MTRVRKIIMRYDVQPDDSATNGKIITDMNSDTAPELPTERRQIKGNIYCTGPEDFWIMSPEASTSQPSRLKLPANLGWATLMERLFI